MRLERCGASSTRGVRLVRRFASKGARLTATLLNPALITNDGLMALGLGRFALQTHGSAKLRKSPRSRLRALLHSGSRRGGESHSVGEYMSSMLQFQEDESTAFKKCLATCTPPSAF